VKADSSEKLVEIEMKIEKIAKELEKRFRL
jgi:hypothetical protein